MDSSDKDQLLMEPKSEDLKDDNDQEVEVALPIPISPSSWNDKCIELDQFLSTSIDVVS